MDMCVCANVYERSRACVRVSARVCALESNRLTLRLSSVFLRSSASVRVLSFFVFLCLCACACLSRFLSFILSYARSVRLVDRPCVWPGCRRTRASLCVWIYLGVFGCGPSFRTSSLSGPKML